MEVKTQIQVLLHVGHVVKNKDPEMGVTDWGKKNQITSISLVAIGLVNISIGIS